MEVEKLPLIEHGASGTSDEEHVERRRAVQLDLTRSFRIRKTMASGQANGKIAELEDEEHLQDFLEAMDKYTPTVELRVLACSFLLTQTGFALDPRGASLVLSQTLRLPDR